MNRLEPSGNDSLPFRLKTMKKTDETIDSYCLKQKVG
jgi:fructose-bisphosphate aldolase class I